MEFTAQMIAQFLGGSVEGDPNAKVNTVAKIEEGFEGALSFLANPKYTPYIYTTHSSIVLVNSNFEAEQPVRATLIRVPDAYGAFAQLLDLYAQAQLPTNGVEQPSYISSSAQVHPDTYVGAFAYIADGAQVEQDAKIFAQVYIGRNVHVGQGTVIYPGAKIYDGCHIGSRCTIHAGAVIGADGFGFAPQEGANFRKIPQIGNVVIEDYVEIGANATVDRATMGSTYIRRGVKLDDHVHIAHNVEVGENTVMAAQCGVAGTTTIGKNCMFGGQVGITPHTKIGDGVRCGAKSGISGDVKPNSTIFGMVAQDVSKERRVVAVYKNLPELARRLGELERMVSKLKSKEE
ncbi:MAG: UDP-3-O-(3-hydroxymyristoyl)glucosamine N-acyltransferase [Bacteroidales bacterium]|nr:UDP-3-O-(3-hydroxymyristoyl)glucosamine N-acyltransferase [Bacteroidales bacterium]